MRLLFITPRFPYPPLRGDTAVPYHRIRLLSKKHEITLLSFYEKEDELLEIKKLSQYCHAIYTIKLPKWQSIQNVALRAPFSWLPLQVLYYHSAFFQKKLATLLEKNRFDLIHVFMLRVAPFVSGVQIPKILELIDSMQLNLERRIALEGILKKWLLKEEYRRVVKYERTIGELFDQMIVVSEKDKVLIPSNNIATIPLGVDTHIFAPQEKLEKKPVIAFSGNMFYAPNVHAVKWFVDKCLSEIHAEMSEVSLIIAGRNPPKDVCDLGNRTGITVLGFVESMPEILNKATVAIAPMQSGSGMQFKILEAMACALPVVTTTLGLGDIKARPGEEIYVADTAEEYVKTVVTLLKSPEMAKRIGRNAREFVINHHSWEHAASQVEEIYDGIIDKRI